MKMIVALLLVSLFMGITPSSAGKVACCKQQHSICVNVECKKYGDRCPDTCARMKSDCFATGIFSWRRLPSVKCG